MNNDIYKWLKCYSLSEKTENLHWEHFQDCHKILKCKHHRWLLSIEILLYVEGLCS